MFDSPLSASAYDLLAVASTATDDELRKAYRVRLRQTHPDQRVYTFWHYWRRSFERDAGIRIDHALLSPSLAKKLKAAGGDPIPRGLDKTRDHAPMWVEVEV